MNGLDFDHRVLRPWANDPAFYVTVFGSESDQPAREGHYARGSLELWQHALPLAPGSAAAIRRALHAIPPLLAQARLNLIGTGRDLWVYGARRVRAQSAELERFRARLADAGWTGLEADIEQARLELRRCLGGAVDRGRLVRAAVAIALADLDANGPGSELVRRLSRP